MYVCVYTYTYIYICIYIYVYINTYYISSSSSSSSLSTWKIAIRQQVGTSTVTGQSWSEIKQDHRHIHMYVRICVR